MHKERCMLLCIVTQSPTVRSGFATSFFYTTLKLRLAAAAAGAEQALVMRTVTAAAEQNDKRDDNDPNGAVVEQIAQTIHSIASLIYNGIADCKSL